MTRSALITGIAGQDGSYLAELLLAKGYRVVGTVPAEGARSLTNLATIADQVTVTPLDLGDHSAVTACLAHYQPDEIYNLAAMSFSPDAWDAPRRAGEVLGLWAVGLLEAVRAVVPKCRCFQAGSSEMYGLPAVTPQNEQTPFRPTSPYGAAKTFAHSMAQIFRKQHGLFVANGILFPHESPRRDPRFLTRKVTSTLARIVRREEREIVLGNLDASRDWSYAGDVVEGMWLALQAQEPDDFVFSSGTSHTVREFCAAACARVGRDYRDLVRIDTRFVRVESGQIVGDARKAHDQLGWRPKVGFTQLVAMMVDHDLAAGPSDQRFLEIR